MCSFDKYLFLIAEEKMYHFEWKNGKLTYKKLLFQNFKNKKKSKSKF